MEVFNSITTGIYTPVSSHPEFYPGIYRFSSPRKGARKPGFPGARKLETDRALSAGSVDDASRLAPLPADACTLNGMIHAL